MNLNSSDGTGSTDAHRLFGSALLVRRHSSYPKAPGKSIGANLQNLEGQCSGYLLLY
jgi:hypothetical protein